VVNEQWIAKHWDDMMRLAGSLKLGKAMAVMPTLHSRGQSLWVGPEGVLPTGDQHVTLLLQSALDHAHERKTSRP